LPGQEGRPDSARDRGSAEGQQKCWPFLFDWTSGSSRLRSGQGEQKPGSKEPDFYFDKHPATAQLISGSSRLRSGQGERRRSTEMLAFFICLDKRVVPTLVGTGGAQKVNRIVGLFYLTGQVGRPD